MYYFNYLLKDDYYINVSDSAQFGQVGETWEVLTISEKNQSLY